MAEKKMGLVSRLIIGSEKSEGYARASLPSNRLELFWDILKGRLGKLTIVNLLTFIFFIPLIAVLFLRTMALTNYGISAPFAQCFGVGYMAVDNLSGYSENIVLSVNTIMYAFMPLAFMIAAVGVSGGAYVIRNMVWTEGIFVANDFWRGIRQNVVQMILVGLIFSAFFYMTEISVASANRMLAMGVENGWLLVASKVAAYIITGFVGIMCMHAVTVIVTYKVTFWQLIKNSFLFTVGLLPHSILFLAIGLVPFILCLFSGIIAAIGYALVIFIGFSWLLLVWTDFDQWAFDKFINDRVPGAKKNRGIYEKIKESDSESLKRYQQQLLLNEHSMLHNKPVKPVTDEELKLAELPESYSREDIEKLNQSRQAIIEDSEKYIEEHKNDPEFQKSEDEIKAEQAEEERQQRIEQAKRELAGKNKNKKK